MTKKEKRYGRPPKADPATHKYSLHLNSKDNAEFIRLFENSGIRHKSHFIASCIFDKQMKVESLSLSAHPVKAKSTNTMKRKSYDSAFKQRAI
ncbi:MAG: hypothetical protein SNJ29_02335, partial [Rikenellaceae bacterium]